ncbi:MAG TPA: DUF5074 domain-containing protein [Bacteroidia bacterium]|nr:DUF5074 domain-containing protein [Bacteroidia bacterium]
MKNFMLKTTIVTGIIFISLFSSCKKDEPPAPNSNGMSIAPGDGVFVMNEGNYQGGNAKVSFYKYADGSVTEDLFMPANDRPLGDVGQSITMINGYAYVVVNNSGKIEVVDPHNFVSLKTITGFTSPRFVLQVSPTKAYVSDLFGGGISILNLTTNSISGYIPVADWTETMLMTNGQVFVCAPNHDKVYVVDPNSNSVIDSIAVVKGGNSMQLDANGKLWFLSYGDYATSAPGALIRINTTTHTPEMNLPFTTFDSPTRLCMNAAHDSLYYLNYAVMRMSINDVALPIIPFISQGTMNFYGLNVNPANGDIYVTDAVDYSQRGHLVRYSVNGTLLDNKIVGVIPGGIYFY